MGRKSEPVIFTSSGNRAGKRSTGPPTNRIAKAACAAGWGFDRGSKAAPGKFGLNDFSHWKGAMLEDCRVACGGRPKPMGHRPEASIWSEMRWNSATLSSGRYTEGGAAKREAAMLILSELNRKREALYTPEVLRVDFESMVRHYAYLEEAGVRRILRVTTRGIRREGLSGHALLPRAGESPAWVSPIALDMRAENGARKGKFARCSMLNFRTVRCQPRRKAVGRSQPRLPEKRRGGFFRSIGL